MELHQLTPEELQDEQLLVKAVNELIHNDEVFVRSGDVMSFGTISKLVLAYFKDVGGKDAERVTKALNAVKEKYHITVIGNFHDTDKWTILTMFLIFYGGLDARGHGRWVKTIARDMESSADPILNLYELLESKHEEAHAKVCAMISRERIAQEKRKAREDAELRKALRRAYGY
ncbi:MAG: hypothetical protein WCW87_00370 [Candidatus Paceibacterota bacterium]